MSRTVAALYSTRAEAETAQAKVRAQLPAQEAHILGGADGAQLTALPFSPSDRATYEQALKSGDFLLYAKLASGENPDRIVRILSQSVSLPVSGENVPISPSETVGLAPEDTRPASLNAVYVGAAHVLRGGGKVSYRSPSGEDNERVSRSLFCPEGAIRIEQEEISAEGLLRDRVIDVSEMSEVPLLQRRPFVREELVIRHDVEEHSEVVRDTVRRTVVDVSDLKDPVGAPIVRPASPRD